MAVRHERHLAPTSAKGRGLRSTHTRAVVALVPGSPVISTHEWG